MTTAADIITLALKDIQVLDESETPSAALMSDALTTLNQMLALWQAEGLNIYADQDVSFVPDGSQSYTIASSPQKINYAFHRVGTLDYPLLKQLTSFEQWQEISLKSQITYPEVFFYNPTYPLGTIYLYPQPNTGTMHIGVDVLLPTYATLADSITLPDEYALVMRFSLCEILAAMMGKPLRPDLAKIVRSAKRSLRINNFSLKPTSSTEPFYNKIARVQAGF